MKRTFLYIPALLLLAVLFLGSCNKSLVTPKSAGQVSTISTGGYAFDYITVDKGGNIYGLRVNAKADTIYRLTTGGNRTLFYTNATNTSDTARNRTLDCLTTDSLGNVYTLDYNGYSDLPIVLKISPSGSPLTVYGNINLPLMGGAPQAGAKIGFDPKGDFYYSGYSGLGEVSASGTISQLVSSPVITFTPDTHGNVYYVKGNAPSAVQKISSTGTTSTFTLSNDVISLGADVYGNVYTSGTTGSGSSTEVFIQKIKQNDSVKTVLASPLGHQDGSLNTAQIWPAFSLVTDAQGNLYFSEASYTPADIRKITF